MSAADDEVIFEIQRIGAYQRIAAVHVPTGTEVVVQAPAHAAFVDVRALALRKLDRALQDKPDTTEERPGKLV